MKRSFRGWLVLAVLLIVTVPTIVRTQGRAQVVGAAQWTIPPEYRSLQAQSLQIQRRLLVAMADSMPESLYRDKATPVQRDFAQQIRHAAGEAYRAAVFAMGMTGGPELPDTATAFRSRAGLVGYVTAAYDQLDQWLASQSDESRNEVINFYGNEVPRWRVWDEIAAYTTWTAGQVVANFRKNVMAPPGFNFFPVK